VNGLIAYRRQFINDPYLEEWEWRAADQFDGELDRLLETHPEQAIELCQAMAASDSDEVRKVAAQRLDYLYPVAHEIALRLWAALLDDEDDDVSSTAMDTLTTAVEELGFDAELAARLTLVYEERCFRQLSRPNN
jgi:hypothetical protein